MGELQLAFRGLVGCDSLTKKFCDPEDGSERIIQLVRHTSKHLSHGGEFFGLDELFLETLEIGDVATGKHHTLNITFFVGERTEIETDTAPIPELMADAHFQRSKGLLASEDICVECRDGGRIFRMGAPAKFHALRFLNRISEHFLATRADKGVVGRGVEDEDEIGETVDEAMGKFLLLVEAALHLTPLGNIHDCALVAHNLSAVVTDGGCSVQTYDGGAVLADEGDFPSPNHWVSRDLFHEGLALGPIHEDLGYGSLEQFFLRVVAQHAHQSGIGVQNRAIGRGDIDALLERFEKLGKAGFISSQGGNVARKNRNTLDFVIAHHGMRDTIKIKRRRLIFQAHLDNPGPMTAFHEARQGTFQEFLFLPAAFLSKLAEGPAD